MVSDLACEVGVPPFMRRRVIGYVALEYKFRV